MQWRQQVILQHQTTVYPRRRATIWVPPAFPLSRRSISRPQAIHLRRLAVLLLRQLTLSRHPLVLRRRTAHSRCRHQQAPWLLQQQHQTIPQSRLSPPDAINRPSLSSRGPPGFDASQTGGTAFLASIGNQQPAFSEPNVTPPQRPGSLSAPAAADLEMQRLIAGFAAEQRSNKKQNPE